MTQKVYRTHQGQTVDIGSLILRNEQTRAVGNMNVNARGDRLDADNRPIDSKNQQLQRHYQKQVGNVTDTPVSMGRHPSEPKTPPPKNPTKAKAPVAKPVIPPPPEDFDDGFDKKSVTSVPKTDIPEGGLAAAIARAREVKQELLPTPKQMLRNKPGVSKI